MPDPVRTAIFVDGQNLANHLHQIQFESRRRDRPYRLDEKHFLWRRFFADIIEWLSRHTGTPHSLVRVWWYYAGTVNPFERYETALTEAWEKCQETAPTISRREVYELAWEWYQGQVEWFNGDRRRLYAGLEAEADCIEFRFVGYLRLEPFNVQDFGVRPDGSYRYMGARAGEKSMDVGLALDMSRKLDRYDAAVLISEDTDFMSALDYLKDDGKQAYLFSIVKGAEPKVTHLAPLLRERADAFGAFSELELLERHLHPGNRIPREILAQIDRRIAELRRVRDGQGT